MNPMETLKKTGLPVAYGFFKEPTPLPYICYIGAGQVVHDHDNTNYYAEDNWQIELYFRKKDESLEKKIEQALSDGGYCYEKSEDAYIEDDGVFVIYYQV